LTKFLFLFFPFFFLRNTYIFLIFVFYMMIVKVPGINGLGKTKGCRDAGREIIRELDSLCTNEKGEDISEKKKKAGMEEIHVNNENIQEQEKLIFENSFNLFSENNKIIFLGGDHSISYSIGKAFFEYCKNEKKEPVLIVFDAHADCMSEMEEPTHEEWLRALIEKGFPSENVLLIGNRNVDKQELEFLNSKQIKRIKMEDLENNLEEVVDVITEFGFGKDKEVYVSIDIDVIDPVFAPATGHKEVGGLTSSKLLYIISRLTKLKNLKGVDIVEINPEKDFENLTVKLGSKILSEFL